MATVETKRTQVKSLLREYATSFTNGDVETQVIFDDTHGHYQLVDVGWHGDFDRVYNVIIHIDIQNDKIWIQRNMTDSRIAHELVERGIPRTDIVLGFQSPFKRPFTEFAVA